MLRVALVATLPTAQAVPDVRAALLLAGDGRERVLFQLVAQGAVRPYKDEAEESEESTEQSASSV